MAANLYQLPMFPLGRVALPGETIPLRIFEARYLEMLRDVEAGSGEFGIVLISRGWEVGGGDDRVLLGTASRVVRDVPLGDEQRTIVALASRRVKVVEWTTDDPYPQALVVDVADVPAPAELDFAPLQQRVRRLYALASELGADTGRVALEGIANSAKGLWQLASLVPLGEFDRQRLLETSEIDARANLLSGMIDEAIEELVLRLSSGG